MWGHENVSANMKKTVDYLGKIETAQENRVVCLLFPASSYVPSGLRAFLCTKFRLF